MAHAKSHPQRGETLRVLVGGELLAEFEVEDWADRVDPKRVEDDMVYGRILSVNDVPMEIPLSRTFPDESLRIRHA